MMSEQAKKTNNEDLTNFIQDRYLPAAAYTLLAHLGKKLPEWIAEHTDLSERVLTWHMTDDSEYCYSFDSLGFPTKEQFIQDLIDPVRADFERDYGEFIRSLSPDNHVKIVTFVEFIANCEERIVLHVAELNISQYFSVHEIKDETIEILDRYLEKLDSLNNSQNARIRLYQEYINEFLNHQYKGQEISLDKTYPIGLDEDQKKELLQSLALKMMRLNHSQLKIDQVDRHFEAELVKFDLPKDITGEQIRQLFVHRVGLLRQSVVGQIDFIHHTFREYLAVRGVLYEDSFEDLLERAADNQWREAIIIAARLGKQRQRDYLLRKLINQGNNQPEKKYYLHLLAVACLEAAKTVNLATMY